MERRRADPAVVTGLSPKEGIPGTQVTIRGENLGVNQVDLVGLTICGVDCLMSARWESSRKIVARVGLAKGGMGDVVVTTRSGGRGTGTVQFRVFNIQIGPLEESAVWVDEARSAPGLQRDVTSNVTTALVDDDPLGIGNERSSGKLPESALSELFPDGSGNLRLENFVPAWYLIQNHQNASFDDLKKALAFVQRHGTALREGPLDFLKSNLNSSINCVDALAALHEKLDKDRASKGWPLTQKLLHQTVSCRSDADFLFTEVLNRKERADATRHALSVLQRFKFLFFLPSSIERNVAKGTYAAIFNDYARAKSLFTETEVPLFKEVFVEVEKRMNQFRQTLKDRSVEMPANLDEQKKIIRYLLMLEPESDAGWDCLSADYNWLQTQLWEGQEKHFKVGRSSNVGEAYLELDEKLEIPQRFLFVDSICAILTGRLQQFLKLAQAYVAGQLSAKPNLHKEGKVESMVRGIVQLACSLLVNAVLPEALSNDIRKQYENKLARWLITTSDDTMNLMQSLRTLRSTVATLLQQEFFGKHIEPLYELCVILRMKCFGRIIEQAQRGVYDLQQRENWKVQISEKGYAKTLLPDQFESLVNEIIPVTKQILACGGYPGEIDLFTIEKRRESILHSFESLLTSFKETLEQLARIFPSTTLGRGSSPAASVISTTSKRPSALPVLGGTGTPAEGRSKDAPVKDRKLLTVLGNCDYALQYTLPSLVNRLRHGGMQYSDRVLERCRATYAAFRNLLLKMYIDAKCYTFSDLIDPVDYGKIEKVNDVSNYIKDLVLLIVSVQAELFLVAAHFTTQVMSFTVRHCCDRLIAHAKKFHSVGLSTAPATQVYLDLSAFELTVKHFMAPETKNLLVQARSHFETKSDKATMAEKLDGYQKRMKLTILSLEPAQSAAG